MFGVLNRVPLVLIVPLLTSINLHVIWVSFQVVLAAAHAKAATKEILETHCIASDKSPDLMTPAAAAANGTAGSGGTGNDSDSGMQAAAAAAEKPGSSKAAAAGTTTRRR